VTETLSIVTRDHILRLIRSEYLEMPDLRLTCRQAQRLWELDEHTSAQLLDLLVEVKFLHRKDDGTYSRLTEGAVAAPPLRMAKAEPAGTLRAHEAAGCK